MSLAIDLKDEEDCFLNVAAMRLCILRANASFRSEKYRRCRQRLAETIKLYSVAGLAAVFLSRATA